MEKRSRRFFAGLIVLLFILAAGCRPSPHPPLPTVSPATPAPSSSPSPTVPVLNPSPGPRFTSPVPFPHGIWDPKENVLTAEGRGTAPPAFTRPAQVKAAASRAARVVAQRNLLKASWELEHYRQSGWRSIVAAPDRTQGEVSGAMLRHEEHQPDGSCLVRMSMPAPSAP